MPTLDESQYGNDSKDGEDRHGHERYKDILCDDRSQGYLVNDTNGENSVHHRENNIATVSKDEKNNCFVNNYEGDKTEGDGKSYGGNNSEVDKENTGYCDIEHEQQCDETEGNIGDVS